MNKETVMTANATLGINFAQFALLLGEGLSKIMTKGLTYMGILRCPVILQATCLPPLDGHSAHSTVSPSA